MFTDVTDDTEWTTKITANALTSLPVGNGKIDEVAESNEKRFNGVTVSLIKKKPFEFTSYILATHAAIIKVLPIKVVTSPDFR